MMQLRSLGGQGLTVATAGLGCMGMSFGYGPSDDDESVTTVHRALDLGVTLLDTADVYGPWTNEKLLAKALAGRRDRVVIATKFGIELDETGRRTGRVNGRPDYVARAVDGSLRRLGTDRIDLYYQHRVDPGVPIEESFGALAGLVTAGKVRYLGISEAGPATIRRAHAVSPLSAVQTEYSLTTRDVENDGVLRTARELGIGFVAYSPIGRGLLSGTIRDTGKLAETDLRRTAFPRFQGDNLTANLALVERVSRLARAKGVTPAQLALAWVLAQGEDVVAIPGTRRRTHLDQNVAAAAIELTAADLADLDLAARPGASAGDRYYPEMMKMMGH
jgi:aryl-alcohol dehydrogenase-like predicted oxidoreductase